MTAAIKVENLSKKYLIPHQKSQRYQYRTLRDSLLSAGRCALNRIRHPFASPETAELEEFWALKNVSFEIKQGDRVGIIGKNGAGKSTLLKILSRITPPTTGKITLSGRSSSLLEVGTGFHPELTGRENIYLNGAVLGMRRCEIRQKFDEIVAFAEVEKFLDTPVKRYSSGMYVRLAFAVAAHLEPEILIVDEVLAVGDAAFQKKCLGKMSAVAKEGRTVLFVSHNISAVRRICNRAFLLVDGRLRALGDTEAVISDYLTPPQYAKEAVAVFSDGGDDFGQITEIRLIDSAGRLTNWTSPAEDFFVQVHYVARRRVAHHRVVLQLLTSEGDYLLTSTSSDFVQGSDPLEVGPHIVRIKLPKMFLNEGRFLINVRLGTPGFRTYDRRDNAISFAVKGNPFPYPEARKGHLCGALEWVRQS